MSPQASDPTRESLDVEELMALYQKEKLAKDKAAIEFAFGILGASASEEREADDESLASEDDGNSDSDDDELLRQLRAQDELEFG